MEFLLRSVLLLAVLNFAFSQDEPKYAKNGGNVTLALTPAPTKPITNILWKFNGDLLAEWVKDIVPLDYYNPFKGRAALDIANGLLTINNLSINDAGEYSVEVNSEVQGKRYNVRVIEEVSKPDVVVQPLICGEKTKECKLTCKVETAGAEPVTYSWKMGDGDWKESGKEFPITTAEHSSVKTFTCRVKNEISSKDSDLQDNPIFTKPLPEDSGIGRIVGGVVGAVLVALVLSAVLFLWKKKKGPFKSSATDNLDLTENGGTPKEEPKSSPQPPPSTTENSNNVAESEKEPLKSATEAEKENE